MPPTSWKWVDTAKEATILKVSSWYKDVVSKYMDNYRQ